MHSLMLLLLLSSKVAAVLPPGAISAKQAEIAAKLSPSADVKLHTVAKTAPSSESDARLAIKQAFPNVELSDTDMTILTFYVLNDASTAMQGDMKAINEEISKMGEQKRSVQKSLQGNQMSTGSMSKVKAIGPNDYYRTPSALPASADPSQLLQRLSDLGSMTDVNQSRVANLMSQKSRYDALLSSMVLKASTTDWAAIQSLK